MATQEEVRASFAEQAFWCGRLGSLFTARLCDILGKRLDQASAVGRRALDWPGDPRALADALALRLCAGLHFMVRERQAPDLAALYPPAPLPGEAALWAKLAPLLDDPRLEAWLESAPQTNEVGRSAVLMSGLLVVAARFGLPIRLYELGASAGLNLLLDHYGYDLGGLAAGARDSAIRLTPEWEGPPPPGAAVTILGRAGADLNPARLPRDAARLPAYLWPDQPERLARLEAALAIAAAHPPRVDKADAADWIEAVLSVAPEPNVTRVVMHSVAFQYFGAEAQARVARHIEAAGSAAHIGAPLAWLRFEKEPDADRYALRLRTWPGGEDLLAWTHPHGSRIVWLMPR
ncbi:MAG: hypothetical protein QOD42_2530 [Sphingomonadales bacterium]|jgi:hypothetical protein|nr:hypothetical protein [Sphingomonadales bacterium]